MECFLCYFIVGLEISKIAPSPDTMMGAPHEGGEKMNREKKSEKIIKVLFAIFIIFILFGIYLLIALIFAPLSLHSEDFSPPWGDEQTKIDSISLYVPLNSTEISKINFEEIRPEIEKMGYNWTNSSWDDTLYYRASQRKPNINYDAVGISIVWNRTGNKSHIDAFFMPQCSFPENELEEKRQYLKEKVQEIAEICNLTTDWSKAEWSVSYYAD